MHDESINHHVILSEAMDPTERGNIEGILRKAQDDVRFLTAV